MNEIYKSFDEANLLFFATPQSKNEPPVIGISFANYDYPKKLYTTLHSEYKGVKYNVQVTFSGITAKLEVRETESNGHVFNVCLNYDPIDLQEFVDACLQESSGAFVLGTFHNCAFCVVQPPDVRYQPFQVEVFSVDLSGIEQVEV